MPGLVGRGGDLGANRNLLFPLAAVLLLSVGVAAVQEEQKAIQEQPQQEVEMHFIVSSYTFCRGLWRASLGQLAPLS